MTIPNRSMPVMPENFIAYKQTPEFNQNTVPKGFLRDHTTAAKTWARIVVTSGKLKYEITEPGHEAQHILTPEISGIIVAKQAHHVSVIADVLFYVEFYRYAVKEAVEAVKQ